ncbi:hypothetical protein ACO2Q3_06875 [Caulobacter sp. KR2-114]|uniref:nucleotidyltransferase domain-containing protein n=1 Tax=Caulobacter sp. KR2-114 TaxID=3400912 RepID=UPI003C003ED3
MAARTSSISEGDAAFARLLAEAQGSPEVLGLWLGGSRGKGRATARSDYDLGLVLQDGRHPPWRARLAAIPGFDAQVFDHAGFAAYAAWGGPQAWDRYSFAHVRALIDRTGDIQALIDAKAAVPPDQVFAFIDAALDRFVNQLYRACKCLRDGDALASRLEAAQAPDAFLDAVFALHGGRLRPYAKYLAWELTEHPLSHAPWPAVDLLALLDQALSPIPVPALQALLAGLEPLARAAGHGGVLDAWGEVLPLVRTFAAP